MKKIATIICLFILLTFTACNEKTDGQKSQSDKNIQSETEVNVTNTDLEFPYRKTIVAGCKCSFGIANDGTLYENTDESSNVIIEDVVSIDTDNAILGSGVYIGLKNNGTVFVGNIPDEFSEDVKKAMEKASKWKDIVAVSARASQFAGLKKNGTVVVTPVPSGTYNPFKGVENWKDIIAIDIFDHAMAGLKSDGTVVINEPLNIEGADVSAWTDIVAISCGYCCVFGLKSDGTVVCTSDYGNYETISTWTDIVAISAGDSYCVGLKSDGTVVSTRIGDMFNYEQGNVNEWTDIVAVSAGYQHTLGLKSDGTVVAVGRNTQTECDVNNWINIQIP